MADEDTTLEDKEQRLLDFRKGLPLHYQQFIEKSGLSVCTLDFLPGGVDVQGWSHASSGWRSQYLVVGTDSSAEDGGPRLGIASINLSPAQLPDAASAEEQEEDEEETLAMVVDGEMKDTMFQYPDAAFLSHPPGDVDRVRHNPRAPYLVATKTIGRGLYACDVHRVWERYEEWKEEREEGQRQAGMQPSSDDDEEEEEGLGFVTLYEPTGSNISGSSTVGAGSSGAAAGTVAQGPAADGYGLCWMHNHQLVSTMAGGQVAVVVGAVADGQSTAVQLYRACSEPGSEVHDVAAAPPVLCEHVFGAATSEGEIVLWDVRAPPDAPAARKRGAHRGSCNSLAFHPHPGAPYNLATGGRDGDEGKVRLWDVRALPTAETAASTSNSGRALIWEAELVRVHGSHHAEVEQVVWNPHVPHALASVGNDSQIFMWRMDKTRVAMFSPPQLRAVHWGHAGPVLDVSWCGDAERPWALASASSAQEDSEGHEMQGGVVQVWAPGRYLIS